MGGLYGDFISVSVPNMPVQLVGNTMSDYTVEFSPKCIDTAGQYYYSFNYYWGG